MEKPANHLAVAEVEDKEAIKADDSGGRAATEHQSVAKGPESESGDAEVEERLRHVIDRVLGANQSCPEERKSRLHEEDECRRGNQNEVV